MKTISRYILTLVALLAVTTGAWADETPLLTIESRDYTSFKNGSQTFDDKVTVTFSNSVENDDDDWGWYAKSPASLLTVAGTNGYTITSCKFYVEIDGPAETGYTIEGESPSVYLSGKNVFTDANQSVYIGSKGITKIEVFGTAPASAASGPEVAWDKATKTGTFTMPAGNVTVEPEYYAQAMFATDGNEVLTPTAAEDAIAGTDAPLIEEGTVAKAGQTDDAQGQVMYAVTTTADAAPALDAFSATVPTAEDYDDATTVFVWYYIQGADAPTGTVPSDDNTFSDSDISGTPLQVNVLSNKFDIQFNAANANTIEAGKATVTVDDQPATVTEGKLEGVKMGSEVKVKANTGYKFRKVEVKKKAPAIPLNITNPVVGQVIGSDGKNYAYGSLPTGVTPVAKICLVSGSNGLALALADEGTMNWSTAIETCAAHTPAFTGGTWKLASQDEWNSMISAAGSDSALRNGFSSVGGTNMEEDRYYWSSTEYGPDDAGVFCNGEWDFVNKNEGYVVRACLAF